jgi:hypothetical protein
MAVEAQEGEELINIKCDQQCRCRGQEAERHHSERVVVAKMADETVEKVVRRLYLTKLLKGPTYLSYQWSHQTIFLYLPADSPVLAPGCSALSLRLRAVGLDSPALGA